ncbi:DUF6332 family protein [Streptomyces sp. P9-2B-2]|uniref:DUF6332 family protein n=1 Tax=Streptomyces TaxID=1883 RepID=UPI001B3C826D|nr:MULTISPECIES: DUF6332 family protein [Streptomyces]MCX4638427.1 DUF6332 family protein [Streptomyces platensis]WJY36981.1 DUF6332 family protein [Streptomyces sp. P9-2B-2]
MSPSRTQAERDAITVEIMFALVSGAFLGASGFAVLAGAAVWGPVPGAWRGPWLTVSGVLGGALCCVRVVRVLRRLPGRPGRGPSPGDVIWFHPSHPGRTSPDS